MRIMIIVHALTGGGAERVAAGLVNHLAERGHEVTVVTRRPPQPGEEYGISQAVTRKSVKSGQRHWLLRLLGEARRVRRIKKEMRIEVSVSFLETGNMLNILSRRGERTVNSIRNHTSMKMDAKGTWKKTDGRMKFLDRFADRVVCVSEEVAEDQARRFRVSRRKLRVVNNGCDADTVAAQAALPVEDEEFLRFRQAHGFLFAAVGRLDVQKGHRHLVRALSRLRESHPEAGLVILGEGKDRGPVEQAVEDCRLQRHVLLAGRKQNPFAYEARAEAFVLSSLYEGFSNAVLEAMACGLPVICTDCSGVREQLTPERPAGERVTEMTEGKFGIVTPLPGMDYPGGALTYEEEQLELAMKRLCEDEPLRRYYIGQGRTCLKRFTPEKAWSQWDDIIENRA